uniref:C3H1-type domain-containing protein n=1 Tax=Physcomitrium patens TaxID=3218 RepID=A0A2K1IWC6_PHYPA|nr:hypothetical protein PHYPA_025525 [Physcomitrium patens]
MNSLQIRARARSWRVVFRKKTCERKKSCRRGNACELEHGVFECWMHLARY